MEDCNAKAVKAIRIINESRSFDTPPLFNDTLPKWFYTILLEAVQRACMAGKPDSESLTRIQRQNHIEEGSNRSNGYPFQEIKGIYKSLENYSVSKIPILEVRYTYLCSEEIKEQIN